MKFFSNLLIIKNFNYFFLNISLKNNSDNKYITISYLIKLLFKYLEDMEEINNSDLVKN